MQFGYQETVLAPYENAARPVRELSGFEKGLFDFVTVPLAGLPGSLGSQSPYFCRRRLGDFCCSRTIY